MNYIQITAEENIFYLSESECGYFYKLQPCVKAEIYAWHLRGNCKMNK